MRERDFQQQVTKLFRDLGYLVFHFDDRKAQPGFPDLVCISRNGQVVWLELKTKKGIVSDAQVEVIGRLVRGSNLATVVRPDDWNYIVSLAEEYA